MSSELIDSPEPRVLNKASFLLTPVPEGTSYAMHIHALLAIDIEGRQVAVPAGVGITPSGDLPLHTHDDSGVIHVESPKRKTFKLKDFFATWSQPFSKKQILGHVLTKNEQVTILVNGTPKKGIGSQVLHDHDVIEVKVEIKPAKAYGTSH